MRTILERFALLNEDEDAYSEADYMDIRLCGPSDSERPQKYHDETVLIFEYRSAMGDDFRATVPVGVVRGWLPTEEKKK